MPLVHATSLSHVWGALTYTGHALSPMPDRHAHSICTSRPHQCATLACMSKFFDQPCSRLDAHVLARTTVHFKQYVHITRLVCCGYHHNLRCFHKNRRHVQNKVFFQLTMEFLLDDYQTLQKQEDSLSSAALLSSLSDAAKSHYCGMLYDMPATISNMRSRRTNNMTRLTCC